MTPPDIPSFRRLRAFEAAARLSSLSAAAQSLRLTQPALTHSISQLESEIGAKLFQRGLEGSFLTRPGEIFQRRCLRFFAQAGEAIAAAREMDGASDTLIARLASAQVRSLIAIWRTGSFRLAARALGLAEPSLQRPARDLEKWLGVPLYRRGSNGLTVDTRGAELARRLSLAIGEIGLARDEIGALEQSRARLRVGVLALAPRGLLASAIAHFLEHHPQHRIEVVEGPYERLAGQVNDGALDCLLGALRAPPLYGDLAEESFLDDPYALVCRRGHPLTHRARVSAQDLAAYEWIFPTEGLPRRAVLDRFIADTQIKAKVQFETNCLTTITTMLAGSDRLSILSRGHIAFDHALTAIDLALPHPPRNVGLTYRRNWLPTEQQEEFLGLLRAAVKAPVLPRQTALG